MFKKYKPLIPLLLLTILFLTTFIAFIKGIADKNEGNQYFVLSSKHYLAFGALCLNYLIYFFARKYFKIILALTLLFGLLNHINFTPYKLSYFFTLGSLEICFQPYVFFIIILTYLLNRKIVHNLWTKFFAPTSEKVIQQNE